MTDEVILVEPDVVYEPDPTFPDHDFALIGDEIVEILAWGPGWLKVRRAKE